jgi:hypothetical protein
MQAHPNQFATDGNRSTAAHFCPVAGTALALLLPASGQAGRKRAMTGCPAPKDYISMLTRTRSDPWGGVDVARTAPAPFRYQLKQASDGSFYAYTRRPELRWKGHWRAGPLANQIAVMLEVQAQQALGLEIRCRHLMKPLSRREAAEWWLQQFMPECLRRDVVVRDLTLKPPASAKAA